MSSKSLLSQHSETRPTPTLSSTGATSADSFVDSSSSCLSVPEITNFAEPFSEEIYNMTYRFGDETVDDTVSRVAKYLASVEKISQRKHWETQFKNIMTNFNFVTGGRIMSNAGTGLKNTTCLNCFTAGAKVLTFTGHKNIEDIKIGEKVLTHTGNWKGVKNIMSRNYDGNINIYNSKLLSDDIYVTEEHPFYQGDNQWMESKNNERLVLLKYNDRKDSLLNAL